MRIKVILRNKVFRPIYTFIYTNILGMKIGIDTRISLKANLDTTHPKGINIGNYTLITGGCFILSHDYTRRLKTNTYVGSNCFIGVNSVVMPGVKIGDNVVIGAGSVVTHDIPNNTIAAGNPCRVIKTNVNIGKFGRIANDQ